MRCVHIVGTSPASPDWRVYDADGKDISHDVLGVEIVATPGELARAKLTMHARVDVVVADPACACGRRATKIVSDMVNTSSLDSRWMDFEPIGITRGGCDDHPVEPITYAPADVPRSSPWWRERNPEAASA